MLNFTFWTKKIQSLFFVFHFDFYITFFLRRGLSAFPIKSLTDFRNLSLTCPSASNQQVLNYCTLVTAQLFPKHSNGFSSAGENFVTSQLYFANFATLQIFLLRVKTASQLAKCKPLIQTLTSKQQKFTSNPYLSGISNAKTII